MSDDWLVADSVWWGGTPRAGSAVRIEDGNAVGSPVPMTDVPPGAARRRLPGTLLPGLCDAHVHSALVDLATVRAGGIAAVWDLGGVPGKVADLRNRAARPDARLPRMVVAGPFLTAPGGYPGDRAWAPAGSCREVRSADDAVDAVAECAAVGAGLVKVTANASGPVLPAKTLAALVDAAHAAGLPVVVHAEGPGTVAAACDAGADLLAHTPWTEAVEDGLLRAAAGMTWISTLDIHGWGTPTPERETAVRNLRRFLGYGGSVRYGTDLGNGPLPPGINRREIRALQSAGLSPAEVLTTMTAPAPPPAGLPLGAPPTGAVRAAAGVPPCWIPGGLTLDPDRFADVLATARVVGPEVRPR